MTHVPTTTRRSEQGFTLVELAIVMVIIGLLIGGVLKGQELIGNARVTATVAQMKSTDAALNAFQEKYNALPGDIRTPGTRLPNCTTAPCNTTIAGAADGRISGNAAGNPLATNEAGLAFVHLAAADIMSGINPTGSQATFGNMLPAIKIGNGGYWVAFFTASPALVPTLTAQRHYAVMNGAATAPTVTSGIMTGVQAFQLDTKLDDGIPQNGSMQTIGTGCVDTTTTPPSYNTTGIGTCASYLRALN